MRMIFGLRAFSRDLKLPLSTLEAWLQLGVLGLERTEAREVVVTPRDAVGLSVVLPLVSAGARGPVVREIWEITREALDSARQTGLPAFLICDLKTGFCRTFFGELPIQVTPTTIHVVPLSTLEAGWTAAFTRAAGPKELLDVAKAEGLVPA